MGTQSRGVYLGAFDEKLLFTTLCELTGIKANRK